MITRILQKTPRLGEVARLAKHVNLLEKPGFSGSSLCVLTYSTTATAPPVCLVASSFFTSICNG